jgi:hypothetical protein
MPDTENEFRIYLDNSGEVYAVVDEVDYQWALQWKWRFVTDKRGKKKYAVRMTRQRRIDPKKQIAVYLHKDILLRSGKKAPTVAHTIGDHGDGDSLNCRRTNLNWATPSQNNLSARRRRKAA